MGETAIMSMAVSCSVVFMRPISAVMALPAREAKRSAATTGPSSRTSERATSTPIDSVAPYFCSVSKPCSPSTMPTKSPLTMMMMSDSTPVKYTSRITRRKRLKLVPDEDSTSPKKRAITPMRQMPSMKLAPRRSSGRRTRSSTGASPGGEAHVGGVGARGIVERHRPLGLAVHELPDERVRGFADLRGRALAHDAALGDEVEVVDDLHALHDVVGHHDGRRAER